MLKSPRDKQRATSKGSKVRGMLCSLAQPPCCARHLYLLVPVVEFKVVITAFVNNVGQAEEDVQEVFVFLIKKKFAPAHTFSFASQVPTLHLSVISVNNAVYPKGTMLH